MIENKVNIAVVGAGWWSAHNHIPILLKNCFVDRVIVVDHQKDRLAIVQRTFNVAAVYTDMDEMLLSEKIAGVIIATPHSSHYEIAVKCIEAGLPILIEKPMTTSVEDARKLVALAGSHSTNVLVACGWNYTSYFHTAYQQLRNGAIGEIKHVSAQMASPTADLFDGRPMEGTETDVFRPRKSTWADPEHAGGYSWGQMSHLLAGLFYLIDEDPRSVFAAFRPSSVGVDYYNAAVLKTNRETTVSLSGSATMPKHKGFMMDIRIFGTQGVLVLDIERERMVVMHNAEPDVKAEMLAGTGDYPEEAPVERFITLCRGASIHNPADATVGRRSVETLYLMNKSAKSGKVEKIERESKS